ncbi:MAG: hypothetical protein K6E50_09065 [Lachnospiraceae bacterium]|nr:hypothetical protein [Lachnospiraceae bacterium]
MGEAERKIGMRMNLLMGLTLSICMSVIMSVIEFINSGHFVLPVLLLTFAVSFLISLLIGFVIPMGKLGRAATKKMKPGSLKARCVEALISDLIYTPLITLAMIILVRKAVPFFVGMGVRRSFQGPAEGLEAFVGMEEGLEAAVAAAEQAAQASFPPFAMMFLSSLLICLVAGYIMSFVFQPLYMKMLMKKYRR